VPSDGVSNGECAIGSVSLTAGSSAAGLVADGRLVNIEQYAALYQQIGTKFGGDDGKEFALPNLTAVAPNGLSYVVCFDGYLPNIKG